MEITPVAMICQAQAALAQALLREFCAAVLAQVFTALSATSLTRARRARVLESAASASPPWRAT